MVEEEKKEVKEKEQPKIYTKYELDPKINYGFQFPEDASEESKASFFKRLDDARIHGKDFVIDNRLTVVPLKQKAEVIEKKEETDAKKADAAVLGIN